MNYLIETHKAKKSQQEIVGFLIIVLMVVIAGVIFLAISLRPQSTIAKDDADIANFLTSSARFTSDCYSSNNVKYKTLEDLTEDCFNSPTKKCDDGREVCKVLNQTYSEILKKVWLASEVGAVKYYELQSYYQTNISDSIDRQPAFVDIISGSKNTSGCITRKAGQRIISSGSGVIVTELELCKGV